jgi:hypothetical protein
LNIFDWIASKIPKRLTTLYCLGAILLLPLGFQLEDNGREDQLMTYLSVLQQEINVNLACDKDFLLLEAEKEDQLLDLLLAYQTSRQEMAYWFLAHVQWRERWERQISAVDDISTLHYNGSVHSIQPVVGQHFSVPSLSRVYFTYMPIRLVTHPRSWQFAFRPYLTVDELGFTRFEGAYGIALGTYYGSRIGTIYRITFANGEQIYAVLADVKSDLHTDSTNRYKPSICGRLSSGNILEFVMDDRIPHLYSMPMSVRVNYINGVIRNRFPYRVISIEKVGYAETSLNN